MKSLRPFVHLIIMMGSVLLPFQLYAQTYAKAPFDDGMKLILEDYLKIHGALASDSTTGISDFVSRIERQALQLKKQATASQLSILKDIESSAAPLAKAKDVKAVRNLFKELSSTMVRWVLEAKPEGTRILSCEMAKAKWVQKGEKIRNPYYGKEMLECGEFVN